MDMALNPEFAQTLLDKVTGVIEGLLDLAMRTAGQHFDMIELPGDDYAGNTSTVMSPRMFRTFIKPCLARLIKAIREHNSDIPIMLHSDGAMSELLPDIVDLGVDVFHPLEPLPATDLTAVKERFGRQITFLGGIDITHAMPGSREEVVAEVRRRIEQLGPGGGYILAPSNHLQADVPPENVVALFQAAREYGKYV